MLPLQYEEIEQLSSYKYTSSLTAGNMGKFSSARIKRLVSE
jgi:hypothetical protein